jgi:hypothetical protein
LNGQGKGKQTEWVTPKEYHPQFVLPKAKLKSQFDSVESLNQSWLIM